MSVIIMIGDLHKAKRKQPNASQELDHLTLDSGFILWGSQTLFCFSPNGEHPPLIPLAPYSLEQHQGQREMDSSTLDFRSEASAVFRLNDIEVTRL